MSLIEILIYSFGTICFFSIVFWAYYAIRNVRVMRGPLGHRLTSMGAALYLITLLIGAVDAFFFPGSGLVYTEFTVWVLSLLLLIAGGILRWANIRKVLRVPLLKIFALFPHSKYYLISISMLVFIALPLWVSSISGPLRPTFAWVDAAGIIVWALAFANLAIAERMLSLRTRLSARVAGGKEIALLKNEALAVRGYEVLTNTFLAKATPVVGDELVRKALMDYFEYNPILFEGCRLQEDGTINVEPIVTNLDRIWEGNKVQTVCTLFSMLNSKIMELYGAISSPELAKAVLKDSYLAAKKQYGDIPFFFDILRTMPAGVLEEEKLALLSREELEARVRERTRDLEEAHKEIQQKVRELQEAHELLLRSERLATMARLAESLAYDIHNPLAAIKNCISLLRLKLGDLDPSVEGILNKADDQIAVCNFIIENLLNFLESKEPELEEVDIRSVIEESLAQSSIPPGIVVITEFEDDLPKIRADRGQMQLVFLNLISNATEAMPGSGKLVVHLGQSDQAIEAQLTDTGKGIPEENLSRVFEPLFSTKEVGAGLGLTIAKWIVESHGGNIGIQSKVGQGTTATVRLPIQQ